MKKEINLGAVCNNQCKFCMIDQKQREIGRFANFEDLKKELVEARKQGYDQIGFLGGEVTLHPEVLKLFLVCKLLKYKTVHLVTNGRLLANNNFLEELLRAGVNRFSVSIHSHQAEVEDNLTQIKGGFDEKLQAIKNLVKYQKQMIAPITINLVINKLNYQDLVKTIKFFKKLGIKNFHLNYIWIYGRALDFSETHLKYSDFLPIFNQLLKIKGIELTFEGILPCLIKKDQRKYLSEFKDNQTEVTSFMDKQKTNFNWADKKQNQHKQKLKFCQECELNNNCEGIWTSYLEVFGENIREL